MIKNIAIRVIQETTVGLKQVSDLMKWKDKQMLME